jgi:sigma-E factor negative regulatory protein RseA
MKSSISALMDGELDANELDEPLRALRENGEARDAWRSYHLISDVLQGRSMIATDCLRRVAARLAEEPALIGPLPGPVAAPVRNKWFIPSALAASLAAVALVGWMAFAPPQGPGTAFAPVAKAPAPALAPAAQEPARVTLTPAAQDYLYAHQAYSPRNSLQGMAPYVRSVSAEAAPGKP